jgi:octaprenyl-diphosphate synthase
MQLAPIKALVEPDLELVNQLMLENIHSEVPLVYEIIKNLTLRKGKQLRPLILLLIAKACGQTDVTDRASFAVAIEFMHTATLLHDDVIDESTKRRGVETANARFGNKAAILSGDYLYTRTMFIITSSSDLELITLFVKTIEQIVEGEIRQLTLARTLLSEADYFRIIKDKTSLLFSLSAETGSKLAKSSEEIQKKMAAFGLHLGNAFQIIDDVLDYTANPTKLGKNIGDDLAEGKSTLPLIHACKHASAADAEFLNSCLRQENAIEFDKVLAILKETNSINYAFEVAKKESELAKAALETLDDSPYKSALKSLCDFSLTRNH